MSLPSLVQNTLLNGSVFVLRSILACSSICVPTHPSIPRSASHNGPRHHTTFFPVLLSLATNAHLLSTRHVCAGPDFLAFHVAIFAGGSPRSKDDACQGTLAFPLEGMSLARAP